jgi:MFS family permease
MDSAKKTGRFHYAFVIAVSCSILSMTIVSMLYGASGVFFNPVIKDINVGLGEFTFYITILNFASAITLPIAGKMMERYSARVIMSISVAVVGGCFLAMSTFTSVFSFYIAGVFLGIAHTFIFFLCIPTMINRWFKKKVGFFVGLCSSFSGIGGIILNPIAGNIIENFGWRNGYLTYAIIVFVIALPASLLLQSHPSNKGLKPYGDADEITSDEPTSLVKNSEIPYSLAIKSGAFYLLMVTAFGLAIMINLGFYLPSYAGTLGMTITMGATLAAFSQIGNIIGKLAIGYISDKSTVGTLLLGIGCCIAGLAIILYLGHIGIWVVFLGGFLFGFVYANVPVLTPLITRKIVGTLNYSKIYPKIAMCCSLANVIGASLWGFLVDGTGSYEIPMAIGIGVSIITLLIGLFSLGISKKLVSTYEFKNKAV